MEGISVNVGIHFVVTFFEPLLSLLVLLIHQLVFKFWLWILLAIAGFPIIDFLIVIVVELGAFKFFLYDFNFNLRQDRFDDSVCAANFLVSDSFENNLKQLAVLSQTDGAAPVMCNSEQELLEKLTVH
jgi:hypothetical protein